MDRAIAFGHKTIGAVWRALTEPAARVQGADRRNARLLAALMVLLFPLSLIIAALPSFFDPSTPLLADWDFVVAIAGSAFWFVAYGLSRTRYYKASAFLSLNLAAVALFVSSSLDQEYTGLYFLLILVLVSSMILGVRTTWLLVVVYALGILLFPLWVPGITLTQVIADPLAFFLFGSLLGYVTQRHRRIIEEERRATLVEGESRYRELFNESERQAEQIDALRQVFHDLAALRDLDTLLHQIIQRAAQLLGGEAGSIYLYRPQRDVIELVLTVGHDVAPTGITLQRGQGLSGKVWETGQPQRVENYAEWPGRSDRWPALPATVLSVPIRWGDEFLGVLNIRADQERSPFTPEEGILLTQFAAQAAIAIHNARLYDQAQQELVERRRANEAEAKQRRLAETLRDVTLALTAQVDPGAVLAEIVRQARRIVPYTTANLAVLEDDMLRIAHLEGYPEEVSHRLSVPERRWDALPLDLQAIQSQKPVLVPDTWEEEDWQTLGSVSWRSYLSVPIVLHDEVLGLLRLNGTQPHQFHRDHVQNLRPLANAAAIALENARLFEQSRRQAEELEALRQVALDITAQLDLNTLLQGLVESALDLLDARSGSLYLYRPDRDVLEWSLRSGPGEAPIGMEIARGDGLSGKVWQRGEALVVGDYSSLDRPLAGLEHHKLGSVVGVPIYSGDEFLGVISATKPSGSPDRFDESSARLLSLFADQAAVAINNARLYEQAQEEIAERKRAEQALRESEERYRTLFEGVPLGLYRTTPEGQILNANTSLVQMLGYSDRASLLAADATEFFVDRQDRRRQQEILEGREILRGMELDLRRPDGSHIWVRDNVRVIRDAEGQTLYYEGSLEDITDRKHAEDEQERLLAQMQEQARQMQQIMDAVPEGLFLLDRQERVLVTNPRGREILASLAGVAVGERLTRLGNRPVREILTSPPKGLWHEVRAKGRTFEAIAQPLNGQPRAIGWVLVVRDITREREIQQRHRQQERLAAVGQLAAGIAHDFNNIMSVIILHGQLALRNPALPEGVPKRLGEIVEQARRASALIQQILDFSRRAILERRPLDLLPVLKEERKLLERTLPENIVIQLRYGRDDYTVNADLTRMQQVIMNLALNARDAMPQGGELSFRLARFSVREAKRAPLVEMAAGEWIELEIADTGEGIPEKARPRIFEPFFTTKAPDRGSGLGLAQVYGIVRQHEGHIAVETEIGQGTTFTIYLPALPVPESRSFQDFAASLPKGRGETILLVEDNAATRAALLDGLRTLDYRVLEAAHGEEALGVYQQHGDAIVLVLTDLVMPEMGGRDLLHALRQHDPRVKVVFLTGHPLNDEGEELKELGASAWLQKPVNLETLATLLAEMLH